MEASVTTRDIEQTEAEAPVEPPVKHAAADKMFKFSEYLDVGDGAADCPHARDGECENVEHFHAWCRLPNPIQQEGIRKTAAAAKARILRLYADPESDVAVVLDSELGQLHDEAFRSTMIDELLARDWAADYLEAQRNVEEREEYAYIDEDRIEFHRLGGTDVPEAERTEEHAALAKHMSEYVDAIRDELIEVRRPRREELEARSIDGLVELLRARRVDEEGDRAFIDTFNYWQWFVGTFKVEPHKSLRRPHLPMWEEMGTADRPQAGTMFGEAPEVIRALRNTFNGLQSALQRSSSGN